MRHYVTKYVYLRKKYSSYTTAIYFAKWSSHVVIMRMQNTSSKFIFTERQVPRTLSH